MLNAKDEFVLNKLVAQYEKCDDDDELLELEERILELDPEYFTRQEEEIKNETE